MKKIAVENVGEALLRLLAERGIDYLFANAGTDFAPIIEGYARLGKTGEDVPLPVTVPHENVAVAAAMGFFLLSGKTQAVMVHVNVGSANALCGMFNAMRGDVPILFMSVIMIPTSALDPSALDSTDSASCPSCAVVVA